MMENPYFWPGTKVVRSLDNDFNWRAGESEIAKELRSMSLKVESGMKGGQVTRQQYQVAEEKPYQKNAMILFSRAKARGKK